MKKGNLQNNAIWEELRRGMFTGSQFYRLVGSSKKGEPISEGAKTYIIETLAEQIKQAKLNKRKFTRPSWMVDGLEIEEEAQTVYEIENGVTLEEVGFKRFDDISGVSADALISDGGIYEGKKPDDFDTFLKYYLVESIEDLKRYFPEYYWQLIGALRNFPDRDYAVLHAYSPDFPGEKRSWVFRLNRSDGYGESLVLKTISEVDKAIGSLDKCLKSGKVYKYLINDLTNLDELLKSLLDTIEYRGLWDYVPVDSLDGSESPLLKTLLDLVSSKGASFTDIIEGVNPVFSINGRSLGSTLAELLDDLRSCLVSTPFTLVSEYSVLGDIEYLSDRLEVASEWRDELLLKVFLR
jgi:hypothetical protein